MFFLVLAIAGFALASPVHGGGVDAAECDDHTLIEPGSPASLGDTHHVAAMAILARVGPGLELGRHRGSETLRLGPHSGRDQPLGPRALRAEARAASRARDVVLSYLDFATALAEARAGTLSARSTAPPLFLVV